MTPDNVQKIMWRVDSWKHAAIEAREAFEVQMYMMRYGASATRNAWHWFYDGWCAKTTHAIAAEYDCDPTWESDLIR